MNRVNLFHYLLTLITWCNELFFLIILNSLFTDLLHFLSVFTHRFIQLLFNVMNRIKIINQVWLGMFYGISCLWNIYAIMNSKFFKTYFRRRAEIRRAENISARLG